MTAKLIDRIQQIINSANRYAWDHYEIRLDLTENSITKLDSIIQIERLKAKESDPAKFNITRGSRVWGVYLGEIIRKTVGGIWQLDDGDLTLKVFRDNISPIQFVCKILSGQSNLTVYSYYKELCKKISDATIADKENKDSFGNIIPQEENTRIINAESEIKDNKYEEIKQSHFPVDENLQTNHSSGKEESYLKKILIIMGVVVGVILLVSIIGSISQNLSSNRELAEFMEDANEFIDEGEKLVIMSEQGVSYSDFRAQLVEVKAGYSKIQYSFPNSQWEAEESFKNALTGWDYTLTIWDDKLERSCAWCFPNYPITGGGGTVYEYKLSEYINVGVDSLAFYEHSDVISALLTQSDLYFTKGVLLLDIAVDN